MFGERRHFYTERLFLNIVRLPATDWVLSVSPPVVGFLLVSVNGCTFAFSGERQSFIRSRGLFYLDDLGTVVGYSRWKNWSKVCPRRFGLTNNWLGSCWCQWGVLSPSVSADTQILSSARRVYFGETVWEQSVGIANGNWLKVCTRRFGVTNNFIHQSIRLDNNRAVVGASVKQAKLMLYKKTMKRVVDIRFCALFADMSQW